MRAKNSIILSSILVVSVAAFSAHAVAPRSAEATEGARRVSIVEDQQAAAFRFVIGEKIVAVLDAEGLRVRQSMEYGGTLTDLGTAYFDSRVNAGAGASRTATTSGAIITIACNAGEIMTGGGCRHSSTTFTVGDTGPSAAATWSCEWNTAGATGKASMPSAALTRLMS